MAPPWTTPPLPDIVWSMIAEEYVAMLWDAETDEVKQEIQATPLLLTSHRIKDIVLPIMYRDIVFSDTSGQHSYLHFMTSAHLSNYKRMRTLTFRSSQYPEEGLWREATYALHVRIKSLEENAREMQKFGWEPRGWWGEGLPVDVVFPKGFAVILIGIDTTLPMCNNVIPCSAIHLKGEATLWEPISALDPVPIPLLTVTSLEYSYILSPSWDAGWSDYQIESLHVTLTRSLERTLRLRSLHHPAHPNDCFRPMFRDFEADNRYGQLRKTSLRWTKHPHLFCVETETDREKVAIEKLELKCCAGTCSVKKLYLERFVNNLFRNGPEAEWEFFDETLLDRLEDSD